MTPEEIKEIQERVELLAELRRGEQKQQEPNTDPIKYTIAPEDVEWLMPWKSEFGKDKPDEMVFEHSIALAQLLINEVVHTNNYWWEKELPERIQQATCLFVSCNDVFYWGCADAEDLPYKEIEPLYRMWKADPVWGPAKWCALRRKQRPQEPVVKRMKAAGVWSAELEALPT